MIVGQFPVISGVISVKSREELRLDPELKPHTPLLAFFFTFSVFILQLKDGAVVTLSPVLRDVKSQEKRFWLDPDSKPNATTIYFNLFHILFFSWRMVQR